MRSRVLLAFRSRLHELAAPSRRRADVVSVSRTSCQASRLSWFNLTHYPLRTPRPLRCFTPSLDSPTHQFSNSPILLGLSFALSSAGGGDGSAHEFRVPAAA